MTARSDADTPAWVRRLRADLGTLALLVLLGLLPTAVGVGIVALTALF
ncbi:hypothetical protein [Microbacterium sp. 18062]|nr:hypothetical protein [Microbacterium sp. 18062]